MNYRVIVALTALKTIQQFYPDAVVAGGFVRDMFLRVNATDIDVFVFAKSSGGRGWANPLKQLERLHDDLTASGCPCKPINYDLMYPVGEGGTEVVGVLELKQTAYGLPVQIIMVDGFDRSSILERFDYGACRAYISENEVVYHPQFLLDVKNKEFRLRREREHMSLESSVERYARFKEREWFKDWSFKAFDAWGGDPLDQDKYTACGYDPIQQVPKSENSASVWLGYAERQLYTPVVSPYVYVSATLTHPLGVSR